MAISRSTRVAMKERAYERCRELGADPEEKMGRAGERRLWQVICSETLQFAGGWNTTDECPSDDWLGDVLPRLVSFWPWNDQHAEFIHGDDTDEIKRRITPEQRYELCEFALQQHSGELGVSANGIVHAALRKLGIPSIDQIRQDELEKVRDKIKEQAGGN